MTNKQSLLDQLRLSARCLEINAGELGAAVREIDADPFENWKEGRLALKGIYSRLKTASENAQLDEARFKIDALEAGEEK